MGVGCEEGGSYTPTEERKKTSSSEIENWKKFSIFRFIFKYQKVVVIEISEIFFVPVLFFFFLFLLNQQYRAAYRL
jgi:hypothetical protein